MYTVYLDSVYELGEINRDIMANAIAMRHRYTTNKRAIRKYVREYLFERGVKMHKIRGVDVFYREKPELYEDYVNFCKARNATPVNKEKFWRNVCIHAYNEEMSKNVDR